MDARTRPAPSWATWLGRVGRHFASAIWAGFHPDRGAPLPSVELIFAADATTSPSRASCFLQS